MDLIGPLPMTKLGLEWIVTWVDRTSKTIVAAPAHSDRTSAEDIAALTLKEINCRFGLVLILMMDNGVRFVGAVWRALRRVYCTKLKFNPSYNPQSDPAEHANQQVLEGLRTAVATVVQYDEWDLTLTHITFGLNSHISAGTGVSPFEFAHGFLPRVPLTMGLDDTVSEAQPQEAINLAQQVTNQHFAAADSKAVGQVRLGRLLQSQSTPAVVKVGDQVWLDSSHVKVAVPYKLTERWFVPFVVLEAKGAQVTLDLPVTFGKAHQRVNIRYRCLKFFEAGTRNLKLQINRHALCQESTDLICTR